MTKREWADQQLLTIMHLHENEGLTFLRIGERFGVSKSTIAGLVYRIRTDSKRHFPPCDADGSMPPMWWKDRKAKT